MSGDCLMTWQKKSRWDRTGATSPACSISWVAISAVADQLALRKAANDELLVLLEKLRRRR